MKNFKKTIIVFIALCQTFMLVSCEKEPIEMVQIPGQNYKMSKTEITQKFYESIMGVNPSHFKGENNPVEKVTWYDAISFCNKLSEKYGYTPVYLVDGTTDMTKWNSGGWDYSSNYVVGYGEKSHQREIRRVVQNKSADGFRLPTVAEWEYAAKGGQNYEYAGSNNIDKVAWYDENSGKATHPVAQKKANGYGLYDMNGNVFEWCWDYYDDSDFRYGRSGSNRYGRSGCWSISAVGCTVSCRGSGDACGRSGSGGFRVVRTAK